MQTGLITDDIFLSHDTGQGHPERSARLDVASGLLKSQEWYKELHQYDIKSVAPEWIETVHGGSYADRIAMEIENGSSYIDTPDVAVSSNSDTVARNAAGSLLVLSDAIMAKEVDNAFALVRPPGHHAEKDMAMGFCIYNSVAIAARYLQQKHGLEKILILDWDVHHGNGTQHMFETDPSVFYISTHQYPHYPGTGSISETGIGAGEGATLNCPMSPGYGDRQYKQAFDEVIMPAARAFNPDAVLLSAGFDAHEADPLASINLTTGSYTWMTEMMMELAADCCDGRLLSVLEGGYDLNALAESVTEHVRVLSQN